MSELKLTITQQWKRRHLKMKKDTKNQLTK